MNGSTTGNNGPSEGLSPANSPNAGPPSNAAGTTGTGPGGSSTSQVTVTVNARNAPAPVSHGGGGFGVGRAAHDAGRVLTVAAGVALIAIAALTPLALVAALVWWGGAALRRRRREQALDAA